VKTRTKVFALTYAELGTVETASYVIKNEVIIIIIILSWNFSAVPEGFLTTPTKTLSIISENIRREYFDRVECILNMILKKNINCEVDVTYLIAI